MDLGQWNTYKTKWNHNADTKMYSNKDLFASSNNTNEPKEERVIKVFEGLLLWWDFVRVCCEGLSWGTDLRVSHEGFTKIKYLYRKTRVVKSTSLVLFWRILIVLLSSFSYDKFAKTNGCSLILTGSSAYGSSQRQKRSFGKSLLTRYWKPLQRWCQRNNRSGVEQLRNCYSFCRI